MEDNKVNELFNNIANTLNGNIGNRLTSELASGFFQVISAGITSTFLENKEGDDANNKDDIG